METLKQRFNAHASDAIAHLRGRERALRAEDIRHRIETSRGWAALRRKRARGQPKPGSSGCSGPSKRPTRHREPERPQMLRPGLSDAAKVGEPAYPPWPHSACPPEGLAGGRAPSDPHKGNSAP